MSSAHERSALDFVPAPNSQLAHAQRLLREQPDGPMPVDFVLFPEPPDRDDPAFAEDDGDSGRTLITQGTTREAVLRGLESLEGKAEPSDVPMLRLIGLLGYASPRAVALLHTIPGTAHDLIWLADRIAWGRSRIVERLLPNTDPIVRDWVLSTPRHLMQGELARKIALNYRISGKLAGLVVEPRLWDQAGNLLLAMASTDTYRYEIRRYEQAAADYWHWIAQAERMPASLDRAALLTMVGQDVTTGPAAPVVGDDAPRMLAAVNAVLAAPPWQQAIWQAARSGDPIRVRRARWIVETMAASCEPVKRFALRVVRSDPDPATYPTVQLRVLIDGVPVIATAFDRGSPEEPEYFFRAARLCATPTPTEVRLAEAYCTEGCCGGLYVTIVREGNEVIWKDWRSSTPDGAPAEVRFDAVQYDREVARAEQDHSWEWPARTAARLLFGQLRADPSLLARWDCGPAWCVARPHDVDSVRLSFMHPAERAAFEDPHVQFGFVIDVGGRDPERVAAEVVESLRKQDPKKSAEVIGGSRDGAERLGLR